MSLLRLLTTGKSLVGVKGDESRYQLTSQRLLPRFGSARNPFNSKGNSVPVRAEARLPGDGGENGAAGAGRSVRIASGGAVTAVPGGANDQTVSACAKGCGRTQALWRMTAALFSGWRTRLTGLLKRPRSEAAKPVIPRFTKQPVQGELSLDKIRVVRNDLSDVDLEVVPAPRPAVPAGAAPVLPAGERSGVGGGTWEQAARSLGAGKT